MKKTLIGFAMMNSLWSIAQQKSKDNILSIDHARHFDTYEIMDGDTNSLNANGCDYSLSATQGKGDWCMVNHCRGVVTSFDYWSHLKWNEKEKIWETEYKNEYNTKTLQINYKKGFFKWSSFSYNSMVSTVNIYCFEKK